MILASCVFRFYLTFIFYLVLKGLRIYRYKELYLNMRVFFLFNFYLILEKLNISWCEEQKFIHIRNDKRNIYGHMKNKYI